MSVTASPGSVRPVVATTIRFSPVFVSSTQSSDTASSLEPFRTRYEKVSPRPIHLTRETGRPAIGGSAVRSSIDSLRFWASPGVETKRSVAAATAAIAGARNFTALLETLDDVPAERARARIVLGHADLTGREGEADVAERRDHPVARELARGRRDAGVRQSVDAGSAVVSVGAHERVEVLALLRPFEDLVCESARFVLAPGDVLARDLARERNEDVLHLDVLRDGGGRRSRGGNGCRSRCRLCRGSLRR